MDTFMARAAASDNAGGVQELREGMKAAASYEPRTSAGSFEVRTDRAMSRGDIKTLERPDDTLPEVAYDKMTTLLQEGKVPTSVLVAPTAMSWAGRPMVDVTAAHLTENDYDDHHI